MRSALVLLSAILLLSTVGFIFANGNGVCISCEEFRDAPQARIFTVLDEEASTLEITVSYDNISMSPTRQAINNSPVIVGISNTLGMSRIYKVYTDNEGQAIFDFSPWDSDCITFKVLYCPFCTPDAEECAFLECLTYANMETGLGSYQNVDVNISNATDIPEPVGVTPPPESEINTGQYLPELKTLMYCPPPEEGALTPALCLPLLIIFSMLAGALYLSGKNPFAGFNLGTPRLGRHIRYQARGRGFSFSVMAAVSALGTVVRVSRTLAKGGKKGGLKGALKALGEEEHALAMQRGAFGVTQVRRLGKIGKRAKQIGRGLRRARKLAEKKKASFRTRLAMMRRSIEATSSGAGKGGTRAMGREASQMFMPGSASYSPRISELFGREGRYGLGFLSYIVMNTTLGGAINNVVYSATGRSVFEMIFIDYDARAASDTMALREMAEAAVAAAEEGGGLRVGDRVVRDFRPGDDPGSVVVTLAAPEGERRGQTADGEMQVTIGADGNVTELTYNVRDIVPEGQRSEGNPNGMGQVTIRRDENGQMQVEVRSERVTEVTSEVHGETVTTQETITVTSQLSEPGEGASREERAAWDRMVAPGIGDSNQGFDLGTNTRDFQDSFAEVRSDFNAVFDSIQGSLRNSMGGAATEAGGLQRRIGSTISGNSGDQAEAQQAFFRAATDTLETNLGLPEGTFGRGGEHGLLDGMSRRRGEFGRMSSAESACVAVAEAYQARFGGEFASEMAEASGLPDPEGRISGVPREQRYVEQARRERERGEFASVLTSVLSEHSPTELSQMSEEQFLGYMRDRGIGDETIERMDRANVFEQVQERASSFTRDLGRTGFDPELAERMQGLEFSQLREIAETGWQIGGNHEQGMDPDVGGILARHGDLDRMSPQLAGQVRQHEELTNLMAGAAQVRSAFERNDFTGTYGMEQSMERFDNQWADFMQQVQLDVARRDEHISERDYRQAVDGLDQHRQARRIESADLVRQEELARSRLLEDVARLGESGTIEPMEFHRAMSACEERIRAHTEAGNERAVRAYEDLRSFISNLGTPGPDREVLTTEEYVRASMDEIKDTLGMIGSSGALAHQAYEHARELEVNGTEDLVAVRDRLLARAETTEEGRARRRVRRAAEEFTPPSPAERQRRTEEEDRRRREASEKRRAERVEEELERRRRQLGVSPHIRTGEETTLEEETAEQRSARERRGRAARERRRGEERARTDERIAAEERREYERRREEEIRRRFEELRERRRRRRTAEEEEEGSS